MKEKLLRFWESNGKFVLHLAYIIAAFFIVFMPTPYACLGQDCEINWGQIISRTVLIVLVSTLWYARNRLVLLWRSRRKLSVALILLVALLIILFPMHCWWADYYQSDIGRVQCYSFYEAEYWSKPRTVWGWGPVDKSTWRLPGLNFIR
jgi:hypothetical protein